MIAWWRNLPLRIKLHLPIQLSLLVVLPIAHILVMNKFETKMLEDVELRTQDSATQSLLSLNAMMLTGAIKDKSARAVFLHRMSTQEGVVDFHLHRTDALKKQFNSGLEEEESGDDFDQLAAHSKRVQSKITRQDKHVMRVVVPFSATNEFHGVNCLKCHHVPEGAVLGTISLSVNLEAEYNKLKKFSSALVAGQIFLQFLLFILIGLLIRNVTRSVENLEKVMHEVQEREDFSMRAEVRGEDETGKISKVFNELMSHIQDLHGRLAEKISSLETYYDQTEEELRIGSDIMSRITDAHSTQDPDVRMQINPAAHYSGDIILVSRTPSDTLHIMLADAVGHGLIAAMNLLPLSQIFNAMSKKGFSISRIAEELNIKIHRLMPVDRFICAVMVSIDFRNQVVEVWNGGVPNPILVSSDGAILHRWKSRNLPLGILDEKSFSSDVESFHYDDDCQLFIFSDGFSEAESPEGIQFGQERILQILGRNPPEYRFERLLRSLDKHLNGQGAHDDVSIAMASVSLMQKELEHIHHMSMPNDEEASSNWRVAISLGGDELKYLDAIPLLTQIVSKIHVTAEHHSALYVILSELFNNALEHGILKLDSSVKQGPEGFEEYLHQRESNLASLVGGSIEIEIEKVMIEGRYGVRIRVVDSGDGFDFSKIQEDALSQAGQAQHGRGIALARSMAHKLEFAQRGNEAIAYYVCA